MLKASFKSVLLACALVLGAGAAQAADSATVVSVDGVNSRSVEPALMIDKDTAGQYNRLALTYPGSTGVQYVRDDANWSQYTKAKTYLLANGGVQVGATNRVVAVRKHIDNYCYNGSSHMAFPNTGNAINVGLGDGCAFWQAVKN